MYTLSLSADAQGIRLKGIVSVEDAEQCAAEGAKLLAQLTTQQPWICDLTELAEASSVVVAILMSWQRIAGAKSTQLHLMAPPPRLHSILEASNLLSVFALNPKEKI
jgi:anti-anti-sigma regulatory factor